MKKFTIIFTLLLVPAIAFPWAGDSSIISILADMVSSNLQINSLAVGPVAPTGVAGEARIESIQPIDLVSPNVMKLPSGSSANIAEFKRPLDSVSMVKISQDGLISTVGGNSGLATQTIQAGKYRPLSSNVDNILQAYNDLYDPLTCQNAAGTEKASIDSAGNLSLSGSTTTTHVALLPQSAAPSNPTTGSIWYHNAADEETALVTEHGKALSVSENYTSASNKDVELTFSGGTNTGVLRYDDTSSGNFSMDDSLVVVGTVEAAGGGDLRSSDDLFVVDDADIGGLTTCDEGYYGDTTSDPSAHPKGTLYGPLDAAPTTPTTGAIIFFDALDGNLKCVFADSDVVTIATNP